jgi:hypothetical protein
MPKVEGETDKYRRSYMGKHNWPDSSTCSFICLACQGKDVVEFRFIIKSSSLMDFWPLGNNNNRSIYIFLWGFLKDDILASVETWD